jgi:hypothetical protein
VDASTVEGICSRLQGIAASIPKKHRENEVALARAE